MLKKKKERNSDSRIKNFGIRKNVRTVLAEPIRFWNMPKSWGPVA